MTILKNNALAIVSMLIFIMIFTVLSAAILALVSSHTRLIESTTRRIKGYYVTEAGSVAAIEALRKGGAPAGQSVEWTFNPNTGNPEVSKPVTVTPLSGNKFDSSCDYTLNW